MSSTQIPVGLPNQQNPGFNNHNVDQESQPQNRQINQLPQLPQLPEVDQQRQLPSQLPPLSQIQIENQPQTREYLPSIQRLQEDFLGSEGQQFQLAQLRQSENLQQLQQENLQNGQLDAQQNQEIQDDPTFLQNKTQLEANVNELVNQPRFKDVITTIPDLDLLKQIIYTYKDVLDANSILPSCLYYGDPQNINYFTIMYAIPLCDELYNEIEPSLYSNYFNNDAIMFDIEKYLILLAFYNLNINHFVQNQNVQFNEVVPNEDIQNIQRNGVSDECLNPIHTQPVCGITSTRSHIYDSNGGTVSEDVIKNLTVDSSNPLIDNTIDTSVTRQTVINDKTKEIQRPIDEEYVEPIEIITASQPSQSSQRNQSSQLVQHNDCNERSETIKPVGNCMSENESENEYEDNGNNINDLNNENEVRSVNENINNVADTTNPPLLIDELNFNNLTFSSESLWSTEKTGYYRRFKALKDLKERKDDDDTVTVDDIADIPQGNNVEPLHVDDDDDGDYSRTFSDDDDNTINEYELVNPGYHNLHYINTDAIGHTQTLITNNIRNSKFWIVKKNLKPKDDIKDFPKNYIFINWKFTGRKTASNTILNSFKDYYSNKNVTHSKEKVAYYGKYLDFFNFIIPVKVFKMSESEDGVNPNGGQAFAVFLSILRGIRSFKRNMEINCSINYTDNDANITINIHLCKYCDNILVGEQVYKGKIYYFFMTTEDVIYSDDSHGSYVVTNLITSDDLMADGSVYIRSVDPNIKRSDATLRKNKGLVNSVLQTRPKPLFGGKPNEPEGKYSSVFGSNLSRWGIPGSVIYTKDIPLENIPQSSDGIKNLYNLPSIQIDRSKINKKGELKKKEFSFTFTINFPYSYYTKERVNDKFVVKENFPKINVEDGKPVHCPFMLKNEYDQIIRIASTYCNKEVQEDETVGPQHHEKVPEEDRRRVVQQARRQLDQSVSKEQVHEQAKSESESIPPLILTDRVLNKQPIGYSKTTNGVEVERDKPVSKQQENVILVNPGLQTNGTQAGMQEDVRDDSLVKRVSEDDNEITKRHRLARPGKSENENNTVNIFPTDSDIWNFDGFNPSN